MNRKFLILAAALVVCSCGTPTRPMATGPDPTLHSVNPPGLNSICLHTSDPGGCLGDIGVEHHCSIYSHGCKTEY